MNEDCLSGLEKRLDVIANLLTALLVQKSDGSSGSTTDRILILSDAGLAPSEIARVIGKRTNYVSGILSQKKKAAKKKGGRER